MNRFPFFMLLLLLPLLAAAQEKRVYTVAGGGTSGLGDGGPATAAQLNRTEGIWIDGNCNLYISDLVSRIRKVELNSGIITTIAGRGDGTGGSYGFAGDGGLATAALINQPYGLFADSIGNVYFTDGRNSRVRRVDALTGIISTFAGGGTTLGDGDAATNSILDQPVSVYGDKNGNIYIGEIARIRKVDVSTGVLTTMAGTGTWGFSGDGGLAISAKFWGASGMLFDAAGDFFFADRSNHRIRKIARSTGIITTVAGTGTSGYSGDGGLATNAELSGPITFSFDKFGNMIIGDNQNNYVRIVDASTGIIRTVAGVGPDIIGTLDEGALATAADIHPEFIYLDLDGNLYYSTYYTTVRKITGFNKGLAAAGSTCTILNTNDIVGAKQNVSIYPNPAKDEITISMGTQKFETIQVYNCMGQLMVTKPISSPSESVDVSGYVSGFYFLIMKGIQGTKTLSFTKN